MQAYMKSVMPYRGVTAVPLRLICRELFAAHPLAGFDSWHDTVLDLWRNAAYREERYAALALTGHRLYRELQTPAALPIYDEMIVTGAWWDYVDELASRRIGPLLRTHPEVVRPLLLGWSTDPDPWRRRTSIIAQLGFKSATDLELLYACIEPNLGDRDFFIRKAIGWALRQHAWTDPEEVRRYVAANEARLSPLSRREAVKNINSISG